MQFTNLLIALYARLSKDRSGLSENVDIQLREGEAFVDDSDGHVALRFKDNDSSASKFSTKPRPEYDRLVAAIERGEVEVIVVTEMTRLYRRIEELLGLIKMAERTKLRGIWTTDGIGYDLSTPEGIHAAIAAVNNAMLESAKLSKRQKRKKKARAEAGRYLGGYRAYGYEGPIKNEQGELINKGRINVALVEPEVEVIRSSVRRIIAAETAYVVMKDLNKRGIPSPAGKQWTASNFKRQLIKRRYVIFDDNDPEQRGTLEHHGQEYRAIWPGIITRTEYELMMARLNSVNQPWGHGLIKGRTYLLTGFIFCAACNGIAYGNARKVGDSYQRRYRCKANDNHGNRIGCGKVFRVAEPLELFVKEAVFYRFDTPEVAKTLAPTEDNADVAALVTKLTNCRQRRTDLVAEYGRGEHTKEEYKLMLSANDTAIAELEKDLAQVQSQHTAMHLPAPSVIREVWDSSSIEWRRSVVKLLVEKVEILPHGHTGSRTWMGYRFDPESVRITWRH